MAGRTRCAPIGVLTPPRLTPPIITVIGLRSGPTGTVPVTARGGSPLAGKHGCPVAPHGERVRGAGSVEQVDRVAARLAEVAAAGVDRGRASAGGGAEERQAAEIVEAVTVCSPRPELRSKNQPFEFALIAWVAMVPVEVVHLRRIVQVHGSPVVANVSMNM